MKAAAVPKRGRGDVKGLGEPRTVLGYVLEVVRGIRTRDNKRDRTHRDVLLDITLLTSILLSRAIGQSLKSPRKFNQLKRLVGSNHAGSKNQTIRRALVTEELRPQVEYLRQYHSTTAAREEEGERIHRVMQILVILGLGLDRKSTV